MLHYFSEKAKGLEFTLNHLGRLYRPQLFRGLIKLQHRTTKAFFASNDETKDRDWMSRFVRVRTSDVIPRDKMPFPERWNFNPTAWAPHAVPDLEDWVRKLATTSSYDERKWRELSRGKWEAKHHGIGDVSEMRPAPPGEKTAPSISKSGKDNKRKRASKPEDSQDKVVPARKPRRKLTRVDPDSAVQYPEDEENDGGESALVPRTRRPIEAAKPPELETTPRDEGTPKKDLGKAPVLPEIEIFPPPSTIIPEGESAGTLESNQNALSEDLGAMTTGHSLSLPSYFEEAIEDANALRMLDLSKVLEEDPFHDCYAGIEDTIDLNDAATIFEESQRLLSQAIIKFRAELSQCEAELRKVSGKEKALRLLCNQREEELRDLRAELAKAQKNEAELDKQVTMILTGYGLLGPTLEANTSLSQQQQKLEMIGQLRGEVDQVKADWHRWKKNMDQLAADKEVVTVQLTPAETQLRGIKAKGLARARKIEELDTELAGAQAEAAQAKAEVEKTRATADKTIVVYLRDAAAIQADLREASDQGRRINDLSKWQAQRETLEEIHAPDDEDVVSGEGGEGEEGVPEEEEALKNMTSEGAIPEEAASEDVIPK
ncbi:PREDICTED: uncharacterized protein LOC109210616 [Nicotiana attenuata]|uniref:uncharacterized protein LOC109210616 n=1 Tax=Nicotiana attenuata TaxID=49451 RepID=UPI000905D874|nr:PREDICTED: uncharacterized protein LOC109210616 [Nicotiana attenuata]